MLYPISFPVKAPASYKLILNRRQSVATSPWSYRQSTTGSGGYQWMLEWTWPPMSWERAESIQGWLQSLDGQNGSFRFAPRQPVAYDFAATTLAAIGYSYTSAVVMKGWGADNATNLRVGQYFQIGDQLLQIVTAAATADANGAAVISFAPMLRDNYAIGARVDFVNPTGVFGLATSDGIAPRITPDKITEFGPIMAREII